MRVLVQIGMVLSLVSLSAVALAEDKDDGKPRIEVKLKITARRQTPQVAVEVARIPVSSVLTPLRQPFLDRIAAASEKSPF
ncbi:MAG: hypothetical protein U0359_42300 [Byssovorax sp.]